MTRRPERLSVAMADSAPGRKWKPLQWLMYAPSGGLAIDDTVAIEEDV